MLLVALRQPVINRQPSFKAGSRRFACADLSHTEPAYSAAEYDEASAVVRRSCVVAPHCDDVSFHRVLFLVNTLTLVLSMCFLYVKLLILSYILYISVEAVLHPKRC